MDVILQKLNNKEEKVKRKIEALKTELTVASTQLKLRFELEELIQLRIKNNAGVLGPVEKVVKAKQPKRELNEGRIATIILPKEMWDHIFSNLDDGIEILNTNDTCRTFHGILNPTKTTWLFDKVLPCLADHLELDDILLCRQVCKKWKVEVDKFIDKESNSRPYLDFNFNPDNYYHHPKHLYSNLFGLTTLHDLDHNSFQENLENIYNSSNPFKMNVVDIEDALYDLAQDNGNIIAFWNGIKMLLEQFGRNVSCLKFTSGDLNILKASQENSSKDLVTKDLLHFIPNIRTLRIRGSPNVLPEDRYKKGEMMEFPELSKLEMLALDVNDNVLVRSFCSKYSKQLKLFGVNNTIGFLIASKFTWPNLTELNLEKLDMALINSKNLTAFGNLRKLNIVVGHNEDECLQNILEIVNMFVQVSPNFHFLHLQINEAFKMKEITNLPAHLYASSKLQVLEVEMMADERDEETHYAFLLRFPLIKNLIISCGHRPWNDEALEEEIVEVYKFTVEEESMTGSNIWKLLPDLRELIVNGRNYTRNLTKYNYLSLAGL